MRAGKYVRKTTWNTKGTNKKYNKISENETQYKLQ